MHIQQESLLQPLGLSASNARDKSKECASDHSDSHHCSAYMRRDQIYFIDKDNDTAVSELYALAEYSVRTREEVRKSYLNEKFSAVPNIG